jgi:hypothetical protein
MHATKCVPPSDARSHDVSMRAWNSDGYPPITSGDQIAPFVIAPYAAHVLYWAGCVAAGTLIALAGLLLATNAADTLFVVTACSVAALLGWLLALARRHILGPVAAPHGSGASTARTQQLNQKEFNEHTNKVIDAAVSDGVVPNDAICATARALGVLVAFTARRTNVDLNELLAFAQQETCEYSKNAEEFMQSNRGLWDR